MIKSKNLRRVVYVVVGLIVITLAMLFSLWFHYANKYNLVREYIYDGHKDVYILGSIDKKHFSRFNNYSFEDLCNAITNINPDLVIITCRKDHYDSHSVIDGDIATCVSYAKCLEQDIPVKMVDWWMIDDSYPENATNELQDDNMFIQISRILKQVKPNTKTLFITDSHHFHQQATRFEVAGMKRNKLNDKSSIFKSHLEDGQKFTYPPLASKTWRDRVYFYAYTLSARLKAEQNLTGPLKDKYIDSDHEKFYKEEIKYCKYFINNRLYR